MTKETTANSELSTMPLPNQNPATAATPAEAAPEEVSPTGSTITALNNVLSNTGGQQTDTTPTTVTSTAEVKTEQQAEPIPTTAPTPDSTTNSTPTPAQKIAAPATNTIETPTGSDDTATNDTQPKTTPRITTPKNKSAAKTAKSQTASNKAEKKTSQTSKNTKKSTPEKVTKNKSESVSTNKKHNTHLTSHIVLFILVALCLITSAISLTYSIWDFLRDDPAVTFTYGNDGNSASFTEGSIAEVAAKVTPGVVSIVTEIQTTSFFGQSATSTAAGTGMIVTKDGYVLTNKHVIEGANSIKIVLDDGTTYSQIELVGTDPANDVAFLKIKDGNNLPVVTLGNSKTITAGQPVIAIGNALGQFQNTITSGIISGTGRAIEATSSDYSSSESLTDMIQTDAAINAGNSGGPLVNAAGEVIGINTATSADADGIGFAIPISSVKGMLKNITEKGSADRAYLGIYHLAITPDVATAYNLPVSSGAYIYSPSQYSAIAENSPAAKAGLKDKDIITKINGIEVGKAGSVSTLIGEYAPGDTVQLTVLRDKKEHTINVTLTGYGK